MERIVFCLIVIFSGTVALKLSSPGQDLFMTRMRQLIDIVEYLKNNVNDLDPKLLPTPQDVKRHCELSAFSCFQNASLKTVNTGNKEKIINTKIKQLKRHLPPTKRGRKQKCSLQCPACESYERKLPKEFLEGLKSLLQQMIHHHLS